MPRRDCGQVWERSYRGSLHKVSQPVTVGTFEQSTNYVEGLLAERARLVGVRMFKRYKLRFFESITSKLTRLAIEKCKSTISKGVDTWIALTLFTMTPKHFVIRIDARFEALAWRFAGTTSSQRNANGARSYTFSDLTLFYHSISVENFGSSMSLQNRDNIEISNNTQLD